jgi:hypothetical protein
MSMKKDPVTGVVLNTDVEALNKYKIERAFYRRVDELHRDVIEIKKSIITITERIEKLENKNG